VENRVNTKVLLNLCTVVGLIGCALLVLYGWRHQLFTSQEALQAYITGFGALGAVVFVAFQAVQVVIPILPGGLGCLGGVLLFGPWRGFVYNYAGICVGSIAAFLLAKQYGRPLLAAMFKPDTIAKYEAWTSRRFDVLFAAAIFFPVAPDDFLCYLAGTTPMRLGRFTAIILLGKPAAIALYSLGLNVVFQHAAALF
jgi:uncharacterized membrane protein YdjX (TVP38/TMEM64 family)